MINKEKETATTIGMEPWRFYTMVALMVSVLFVTFIILLLIGLRPIIAPKVSPVASQPAGLRAFQAPVSSFAPIFDQTSQYEFQVFQNGAEQNAYLYYTVSGFDCLEVALDKTCKNIITVNTVTQTANPIYWRLTPFFVPGNYIPILIYF